MKIDETFDGIPFSVNKAYLNVKGQGGKKRLHPDAIIFKDSVKKLFAFTMTPEGLRVPLWKFEIKLRFNFLEMKPGIGWCVKNNTLDNSNSIKLLEDAVCTALGIDDKMNRDVSVKAYHSLLPPKTRVILTPLDINEVLNEDNFYK
jgi:hypothetical protein